MGGEVLSDMNSRPMLETFAFFLPFSGKGHLLSCAIRLDANRFAKVTKIVRHFSFYPFS